MNPTAVFVINICVVALILMLLSNFNMAKWFSVLFSDARNKLGDQVVFSNWKGRPTMRAYVIPANPNTLAQQAQRAKNSVMVLAYQDYIKGETDRVAKWNELALPRQISGFNLFGKYALKIDVASLGGGAAPFDNTITYTCPIDLAAMGMYKSIDGADPTELVATGNLESGTDKTVNDNGLVAGVHTYYIAPGETFMANPDEKACLCAHWKTIPSVGTSPGARTTVT